MILLFPFLSQNIQRRKFSIAEDEGKWTEIHVVNFIPHFPNSAPYLEPPRINLFEFFPMQVESPGGPRSPSRGRCSKAGTCGSLRGIPNARVSCPEREEPGYFLGVWGRLEVDSAAPAFGQRTLGQGGAPSPGLICMFPDNHGTWKLGRNSSRPPTGATKTSGWEIWHQSKEMREKEKKTRVYTCVGCGKSADCAPALSLASRVTSSRPLPLCRSHCPHL